VTSDSEQFISAMDAAITNSEVNDAWTLYQETKDGRYFWHAFLALHKAGRPIPQSFLDKLANIGNSLLSADSNPKIAIALEFSGDKTKYVSASKSMAYERRWRVASEVHQMEEFYNLSRTKAFSLVAKNRQMTIGMVKFDYYKVVSASAKRAINAATKTKTGTKAFPTLDQAMQGWLK